MIFRCTPLELFKRDGKTVSGYGVEWTEPRMLAERFCMAFAWLLLIFSVVAAWGALSTFGRAGVFQVWAVVTCIAGGLCLFFFRRAADMAGKPQFIEFMKAGQVVTAREGLWKPQVADIRSIEVEQGKQKKGDEWLPYTHGVRIVTRHGGVVHVAKNLEPDNALTLAVVMTEAVEAVKFEGHIGPNKGLAETEVW